MICRFGLFLAQIHPSKLEEGISLSMEKKCTIMSLENTRERSIMTHRILSKLLNLHPALKIA